MNFEEFEQVILSKVLEGWKEEADVYVKHVRKNNDQILSALHICEPGETTIPIVYLDDFYKAYSNGESFDDIIEAIRAVYEISYRNVPRGVFDISDFETVKTHLIYRIVNYPRNKELLKDCPHIVIHDLAVTFRCFIFQNESEIASTLIKNEYLENWGISMEELLYYANENTPRFFPPFVMKLDEFLNSVGLLECTSSKAPLGMYIVSNRQKVNGASVILYEGLLKEFGKECNSDYFVLPSSIHEVLFLPVDFPEDMESAEELLAKRLYAANIVSETLADIVREINMSVVNEDDFLSNTIYYYCRETDSLEAM